MTNEELIEKAEEARKHAYAPYSHYYVGAALVSENDRVFQGANIENGAYSAAVCAERVAMLKAVFDGERKFTAIAIVGGKESQDTNYAYPCGECRQVMKEFCDADKFRILVAKNTKEYKEYTLKELFPEGFELS